MAAVGAISVVLFGTALHPMQALQPVHGKFTVRSTRIVATAEEQPLLYKAKAWWSGIGEFVSAFKPPPLDQDTLPEAVTFYMAIESTKLNPRPSDWGLLANLSSSYYQASWQRTMANPAVSERLPDVFVAVNGVVVLVVLRLLLPRLLAIQSMQDLQEFAPELGLPSREELLEYVAYADAMNYGTKLLLFQGVIILEKVTLVGEFLPVGIILPAISPLLFGGVLQGTLISAVCAAAGSSVNFVIAQRFLRERALSTSLFNQPPIAESKWFTALSRNIEKDGFRAALLLRLAPVLPIPIDAHWYVCGLTPLKLFEFFPAYVLGALKATFLDAYLGSMLTSAALGTDELGTASKGILVAETVAVVTVSVLVSQFATQVFAEMMSEEGFEAAGLSAGGGGDAAAGEAADEEPNEAPRVEAPGAEEAMPYDIITSVRRGEDTPFSPRSERARDEES